MILSRAAAYTVIAPPHPTAREAFAAEELARYLEKILGTAPTEGGDIRFIVGGPGRNPAAEALIAKGELDALLTGGEGYLIRVTEGTVLLAGSEGKDDDERGTLYAVYAFLEGHLGCTLAAYSHPNLNAGEIVPRRESITLPEGDTVKPSADLPYRGAMVQYGDRAGNPRHALNLPFIDWLAKNRYNRIYIWASTYVSYCEIGILPELEKRGIRATVRRKLGPDINASCGQLRRAAMDEE